MFIDLVGVGKHQIKYPDYNNDNFQDMKEYLTVARKVISYFAPRYGESLAKEMLSSDDAVSNVATQLMLGDWRWDSDYKNKKKTKRARYSYLNQCGQWAIQGYIGRKHKSKDTGTLSLNIERQTGGRDNNAEFYTTIEDKRTAEDYDKIDEKEHNEFLHQKLQELLGSGIITERQQSFIEMRFLKEMTMVDIAKEYNISREAVRQAIESGLSKLKDQELVSNLTPYQELAKQYG